jgi:hypothetical protein
MRPIADTRIVRRYLSVISVVIVASLAGASQASAAGGASGISAYAQDSVGMPMYEAIDLSLTPRGFALTPAQAVQIAEHSPTALAIHRTHHPLSYGVWVWVQSHYEVYFAYHGKSVVDVIVGRGGALGPSYTGPLMTAVYARGAYDTLFDAPWVFLPFGLLFLLPLITRRPGLGHLDVAMVLSFGVSYALFNARHTEAAVWLAYPPLLYFLGRMLWRGRSSAPLSGRALRTALPTYFLAGGLLLLAAARIFLILDEPHVIDVGYASVIGATRILHGHSPYFLNAAHPDTYGPVAYLAYVPFTALWPNSWVSLPAARAATITFDLLTIAGLLLVGRRLRRGGEGVRLGLLLGWLWAACPFTLLAVMKGTNDGLVALLMVALVLVLSSPVRRGIVLGLATAAKFFPAILLPLLVVGGRAGEWRSTGRKMLAAFVITVGTTVAVLLPAGGLQEMYDRTIGFQLSRPDVFSPWALHPSLSPVKVAVEIAVVGLALLLASRPRGTRSLAQVSALSAALVIAVQLPAIHWFYFYIVWFLPLVLIAAAAADHRPVGPEADRPGPVTVTRRRDRGTELAGVG